MLKFGILVANLTAAQWNGVSGKIVLPSVSILWQIKQEVWSATSISEWQYVNPSRSIPDTPSACCQDLNKLRKHKRQLISAASEQNDWHLEWWQNNFFFMVKNALHQMYHLDCRADEFCSTYDFQYQQDYTSLHFSQDLTWPPSCNRQKTMISVSTEKNRCYVIQSNSSLGNPSQHRN